MVATVPCLRSLARAPPHGDERGGSVLVRAVVFQDASLDATLGLQLLSLPPAVDVAMHVGTQTTSWASRHQDIDTAGDSIAAGQTDI